MPEISYKLALCLELEPFALHCLTRTGRVTGAALRRKDPEFFSRVEAAFSMSLPLPVVQMPSGVAPPMPHTSTRPEEMIVIVAFAAVVRRWP